MLKNKPKRRKRPPQPSGLPVDCARRTGRTTAMLDDLVQTAIDGQPQSIVVFKTMQQSLEALLLVAEMLVRKGLHVVRHGSTLGAEGSTIKFTSTDRVIRTIRDGSDGTYGEFIDHHAFFPLVFGKSKLRRSTDLNGEKWTAHVVEYQFGIISVRLLGPEADEVVAWSLHDTIKKIESGELIHTVDGEVVQS